MSNDDTITLYLSDQSLVIKKSILKFQSSINVARRYVINSRILCSHILFRLLQLVASRSMTTSLHELSRLIRLRLAEDRDVVAFDFQKQVRSIFAIFVLRMGNDDTITLYLSDQSLVIKKSILKFQSSVNVARRYVIN
jgi:hypothetical protein